VRTRTENQSPHPLNLVDPLTDACTCHAVSQSLLTLHFSSLVAQRRRALAVIACCFSLPDSNGPIRDDVVVPARPGRFMRLQAARQCASGMNTYACYCFVEQNQPQA